MPSQLILDTHIIVRWLSEPRKLSRGQTRAILTAFRRGESVAISGMSLLEIALFANDGRLVKGIEEIFAELAADPLIRVLPVTYEIALEFGALSSLRDPGDRVIVATARVHGLRLVTSDQRIIDSKLVPVVE